jgi:MFS family permease
MKSPNPNSPLVKATLLLTSTLTVMAGATIAPSLPGMQVHFADVPNTEYWVKLILTIPALFIVIGAPIAGIMVDRIGRKPLLAAAVLLYGVAGSSGFLMNSLNNILIGRAFLGFAVAGIMTGATTLIADYYLGQARANFMGLQAAFMGLGGVIFVSAGGYLADLNWRYPFLIYLFALIILPLILRSLFEPSRQVIAVSDVQAQRVSFPWTTLALIYGIALMVQVAFYLIPVQLPFYLKSLNNATASQSGLAIALCTLFSSISSLLYGRIKARLGFITIAILDFAIIGIGYVIIGFANSYQEVLFGLAVAGSGLGLLMPNTTVWVSAITTDAIRGRALGGLTTFFFMGQFLSPIVAQPVSKLVGGLGMTYASAGGFLILLSLILAVLGRQIFGQSTSKALH